MQKVTYKLNVSKRNTVFILILLSILLRKNKIQICFGTNVCMQTGSVKRIKIKNKVKNKNYESLIVPEGRDRKIWTARRTNQIVEFDTVPAWSFI